MKLTPEQIDDGGTAFPQYRTEYPECEGGMSLRDWFAGQATFDEVRAIIPESVDWNAENFAAARLAFADAMIAARKEKS